MRGRSSNEHVSHEEHGWSPFAYVLQNNAGLRVKKRSTSGLQDDLPVTSVFYLQKDLVLFTIHHICVIILQGPVFETE